MSINENRKAASEYDLLKYKLINEALGVGLWDMDVKGGNSINPDNAFIWSPALRQMLGYAETEDFAGTLANWLDHLHPDDRDRVMGEFFAYASGQTGAMRFVAEHRLSKTNGEYMSVRTFGMALRGSAGEPIRISGAVADITEDKKMRETLLNRENTLDILNRVALVLLTREENHFAEAMSAGLGLISGITDIDRMSVFRNSEGPDGMSLSQIYRWTKEANSTVEVLKELENVPYSRFFPLLGGILRTGEYLGGQVSQMAGIEAFNLYGCVTILAIPVLDDGKFWGFAFFERFEEKNFTEQEICVLRSASFMLANAVIRNEEAVVIRHIHEQSQLMLDAAPLVITMVDRRLNIIDCWRNAVEVFGFSSKRELMEHLPSRVPKYQPGGKRTAAMLASVADEAFRTGRAQWEWTLLTASGKAILFDTTAVRVKYGDDYALMFYSRDIREEKRTLSELAESDKILAAQTHWYKSILDGIPLPLLVTDKDMKLKFINTASEKLFGIRCEEIAGQQCSIFGCTICGTEKCSIVLAKQGEKQTFFKFGDMSCQVNSEIIYDLAGDIIGHLEIMHDITEVENTARRQADAASEAKSAFLASMSHEMRTPLSAVISLSELILENGGLGEDNAIYLNKIFSAGSTLLTIVNDILDISKIESGKFEIIPQEYDVPNLLNEVITQNIIRIHSKPVHFSLNINKNVPLRLYGDEIRVKQIISNLLSNAFKYTDRGEVIFDVDYEREGDLCWIVFRVSDTGIGIKPADLPWIFHDYTRFDGAANRKIGGTGLGLSIVKRLTELMDGGIVAESEYGKGSVFIAKIRQRFVGEAVIGADLAGHLRSFRYAANKRHRGAQLNRVRIPYAKVLVVDDNLTNLDIARGLMRPYGMEIDCLTNGREAIDAIGKGEKKYHAVFMDHMMPDLDGMETVRIIREELGSEYAKTVPIIALTANALSGNRERFISNGFTDFLTKPIDIFMLDAVIRKWVWLRDQENHPDERVFVERRKRPDRRRGEIRNHTSFIPAYAEVIEGLDWMNGLERFGDEAHFRQILRSFAVNTRPLLELVSEASAETLPQYAIIVHGIKSSSRGIGAGSLGTLAESLEFAAKDGNLDFVSLHNPDFLKIGYKLIEDIEALLGQAAEAGAKPQKDRPDKAELERLRTCCGNYDLDGIDAVMREIEAYEYTADEGLTEWLRDHITRLEYARVIDKIARAVK